MRPLALCVLAATGAGARAQDVPAEPDGYALSGPEQAAIEALLREHAGQRWVVAADHEGRMLEEHRLAHPEYEPYLARADFDGDGLQDLAVALTDGESYDLYVVPVQADRPAAWFAGLTWLQDAALFVRERGGQDQVGVGSFFSDDAIWFGWNAEEGRMDALPSDIPEDG